MKSDIVAKHLLADRLCKTCKHYEWEQGDVEYCAIDGVENDTPYDGCKPLPDIRTCERWETFNPVHFTKI